MADDEAQTRLAQRFETQRGQLRALAFRMLGSLSEADDAVQEAWLKLARADRAARAESADRTESADRANRAEPAEYGEIRNLDAWLRTVVSRVCLDLLRTRKSRREDPVGQQVPDEDLRAVGDGADPEQEAVLIDAVGRALLVVLDTLTPAERIAFVLHDLFAVPFDEIAQITDRTPAAAKKLASRARQRVRGVPVVPAAQLARQRRAVEAFLAASRGGDLAALLHLLTTDVVRTADPAALPQGAAAESRGVRNVVQGVLAFGRRARFAAPALVNGVAGAVVAPHGRLALVVRFTIVDDRIAAYEVIADPARLREIHIAVLDNS